MGYLSLVVTTGWRYRVVAALGTLSLTALAVGVANLPVVQRGFTTYVPLFWRLDPVVLAADSLWQATLLSVLFVGVTMVPLYKPRPRRILDTVAIALRRVFVAGLGLATLGYFEWSHRLPRSTLVLVVGLTMVLLPAWFVWIRRRPSGTAERTLIVGDDLGQIERVGLAVSGTVVGYLCPSAVERMRADGGATMMRSTAPDEETVERLGGFAKLELVIPEYDVDTVVLAFDEPDREEFFGVIDVCTAHGVDVKVHRDLADSVLVARDGVGELVDVDVTPWDPQDYVLKRLFDVGFATVGLLGLSPVILAIALAIKLEDGGSILYEQERTATFGDTFSIYKFRSMVENAESDTGATLSEEDAGGVDPRVTRVGRVLRQTHLDEIPQLWAVLTGDMSVVGPRPERPALESDFRADGIDWQQRWFVKPGLTGLAQINDVTGYEPRKKLQYDIQYVREQSFWYDIKIVLRQIWTVLSDVGALLRGDDEDQRTE